MKTIDDLPLKTRMKYYEIYDKKSYLLSIYPYDVIYERAYIKNRYGGYECIMKIRDEFNYNINMDNWIFDDNDYLISYGTDQGAIDKFGKNENTY